MTTTYQRIVQQAEAEKQRKQESYEPLYGKVYREDEKITSQISTSKHSTQVDDPQSLGILSSDDSLRTLTTERSALLAAGGVVEIEPNAPLLDKPNRYITRRPCTCKHHEGNKWRPLAEFSERRAKNGKMYPQSWCKECTARYVREQYHGLDKRIP